jgi:hypothetical protein
MSANAELGGRLVSSPPETTRWRADTFLSRIWTSTPDADERRRTALREIRLTRQRALGTLRWSRKYGTQLEFRTMQDSRLDRPAAPANDPAVPIFALSRYLFLRNHTQQQTFSR